MAIFVTGATGYIGSAVVQELTWHGFEVRGLARTDDASAKVGRLEAVAVRGDLSDGELLSRAAATHEVVIHCATDPGEARWGLEHGAVAAMLEGAQGGRRPRLFIYTSGVWVYGSSPDERTEDDALAPPPMVAPRLDVEARVTRGAGNNLVTAIVRPGCVYGGAGGITAAWFERARAWGAARVVGPAEHRWAMVHRADLAYLYRRIVETHLGGIWNAVDGSRDPVGACAEAAGRAVGHDGSIEVVPVDVAAKELGDYADCLALDQHVSSAKARTQLGWAPRHSGFVAEARQLAAAWRAHRAR
jgi:nucleoside-diphosphate-sugar epimerase